MILLFMAVVMAAFALIKKQYKFVLIGVEVGLFGSVQELLKKPELAQHTMLLRITGVVCLFVLVLTVIWFAVGGKKDGE